jgi:hypothetical protein
MSPLVAAVLELTDQVHAAIDAGDWPRASELETERRRLLEHLAATAGAARNLAPTLVELEARNRRLIGLVEHHKRRVLREAAVARTANEGAAVYADVRRLTAITNTSA